jgi:PEGA domain-containing protein
MRSRLARLVLGVALVGPGVVPGAVHASDAPACQAVTPADAAFGCLEVFPIGASASVTFDGQALGLSPLGIPQIEPGQHTLRLDRTGFYPWYGKISIGPGEVQRIDPPLPAYYFMDGTVTQGTWTKSDFGSRTFFWDTAGNLVRLNAIGATWIQLVPPQAIIDYS